MTKGLWKMGEELAQSRVKADTLLAEGYRLWSESGLPLLPRSERCSVIDAALKAYDGKYSAEFAAACQCFYLFRRLHSLVQQHPTTATLLGDYFFSQFSKNLIPLDSVPLINAFSSFLADEIQTQGDMEGYLDFIGSLPGMIES
jgi:hypothetical protein